MTFSVRFAALVALTLLSACTTTRYVRIRHPLQVGQVDPNTISSDAPFEESERGLLRGTLIDTASLTELTPERICMQTSLWSLDEVDPSRGAYGNYRIALLNDQEGVELTNGEVRPEAPVSQDMQGHFAQQVHAGYQTVCADYRNRVCVRWRQDPIYRTVYVPHVWRVTRAPASLCFPNGGFVTPATTRLSLEVDDPGPGNMVFEWQFESSVAGQPAPQRP
jgi:hypothetical protein